MSGYPFLLGTTSFIYHTDILTNVKKLALVVDDVELVLFIADKDDNLPGPEVLNAINRIAVVNKIGFTVHLPLAIALGSADETNRGSSVKLAIDIIRLTACIDPRGYIIHLNMEEPYHNHAEKSPAAWTRLCLKSLEEIIAAAGARDLLCIENLEGYDITHLDAILEHPGINLCLDIGHLWVQGKNPVRVIELYAEKIRVIHLHGIHERDHQSLAYMEFDEVKRVLDALQAHHFFGVLTLEVFSYDDLITSIKVLLKWAGKRRILE